MAHDPSFPANDSFLADFPPKMRAEIVAIINDAIVNALSIQGLTPGNTTGKIPISNGTMNVNLNAEMLGGYVASAFSLASHIHAAATTSTNGFMSNTDKVKLDAIAAGAEVNQFAFSNVLVGSITIQADGKTDTLEIIAGANIALTPDATNDRLTIAVTGTVPSATTAAACTGNAATATIFQTARTIGISGDATGTATSFNGSANIAIPLTLAATGVTAGTYRSVTVDAKGRVTAGTNPTTLATAGITDAVPASDVVTAAAANKILKLNASGLLPASITGNAATASNADMIGGKYATDFLTVVASDRGANYKWCKLSNGDIFQCGFYAAGAHSPTITFPIAFVNACRVVVGNITNSGAATPITLMPVSLSLTSFVGRQMHNSIGGTVDAFYWVAWGD